MLQPNYTNTLQIFLVVTESVYSITVYHHYEMNNVKTAVELANLQQFLMLIN